MTTATVSGTTVTYAYAGDDVRATRTVAGSTTSYLWVRQAGLPELVDDGATVMLQTRDGVQTEIAKGTGAATSNLLDGQGSVRAQTNGSGTATGSAAYDPWGNARGPVTTATGMGWTGESRDTTTGLTYLRARDYDPLRGRFIARDTLQPNEPGSQGYNAYAYAAGNPVSRRDPTGHASTGDAIGNLAGGIEALIGATLKIAALIPWALGLPFGLGPVIAALLGWAITMLRTMIVMLLVSIGGLLVGALTGFTGTALYLLAFLHLFRPMRQFWTTCTNDWRTCGRLALSFPGRALESCDRAWCRLIQENRDKINVVGLCGTVSGYVIPFALELAGSSCVVLDRGGTWAGVLSAAWMVGLGLGGSGSFGVLLSTVADVSGLSAESGTHDATIPFGDVNVSTSTSGVTWVISYATGTEWGFSEGKSYSFVKAVGRGDVPWVLSIPVCGLAYLTWYHC